MTPNLITRTGLALTMALAFCSPALAQNGEPSKPKAMKMDHAKMDHPKMMMEQCKGMMDEMKAQDTALAAQIAKLNSAPKDDKVDLMAAILTLMSEQRATMNEKMGKMHMEMMKHMPMAKMPAKAPAKD